MNRRSLGILLICGAAALAAAAGTARASFSPHPAPLAVGIDGGGGPYFSVYDTGPCLLGGAGCSLDGWLSAYDLTLGGVQVAVGDVTGDGRPDVVTAPGKGGRADVRAFTSNGTLEASTYLDRRNVGHPVAVGDVNGDGRPDYVLGTDDWSGPQIDVLDGRTGKELDSFWAGSGGDHGVRVATGDVNGDGRADIVTGSAPGFAPYVLVYPGGGSQVERGFPAFDPTTTGGVHVAAGDLNGDGRAEIAAVASSAQGPELRVFDGAGNALLVDVFPFARAAADSLRVAIGDIGGKPGLVVSGDTPDGPQIEELTAAGTPIRTLPGVGRDESIAVGDVTGDGRADLVVGDGPSWEAHVTVLAADGRFESSFAPYGRSFMGGVRVAAGDFNGDGGTEYLAGQGPGSSSEVDLSDDTGAVLLALHPFAGAASDGVYVAAADVDGDRHADVVVGADAGGEPRVKAYDRTGRLLSSFLAFEPGFTGGVRVAAGDVDGDGKAEIVAGSGAGRPAEVRIFNLAGALLRTIVPFSPFFSGGVFPAVGQLDGSGRATIAVGAGAGGDGVVRTFDGLGRALLRFQPYGETSTDVRVAVGDVVTPGVGQIITAAGRVAPASVDVWFAGGGRSGSFSANDRFQGGLFVGAQEPLGRPLSVAQPDVTGVEGKGSKLYLGVSDPDAVDTADDLAATVSWVPGSSWVAAVLPPGLVTSSHVFTRAGVHRVDVVVVDRWRRSRLVSGTARIEDAPLHGQGLVLRRFRGVVATFRDENRFARARDFAATVQWDGGLERKAVVLRVGPGRFVVRAKTHGRRVAIVHVSDFGGSDVTMRTVLRP
jgi:hypothetical protein